MKAEGLEGWDSDGGGYALSSVTASTLELEEGGWVPGGWGPLQQVTGEQGSEGGLALNRGHLALSWKPCIGVSASVCLSSDLTLFRFYAEITSLPV